MEKQFYQDSGLSLRSQLRAGTFDGTPGSFADYFIASTGCHKDEGICAANLIQIGNDCNELFTSDFCDAAVAAVRDRWARSGG